MFTDLDIEPETQAELELLEDLAAVRNVALEQGIDQVDIARAMIVYGEVLLRKDFDNPNLHASSDEAESEHQDGGCPNCGGVIEDVEIIELGSLPEVQPCGCEVELDLLPDEVIK